MTAPFNHGKAFSDLAYEVDSVRLHYGMAHALAATPKKRAEYEAWFANFNAIVQAPLADYRERFLPKVPALEPELIRARRIAATIAAVARAHGAALLRPDNVFALAVMRATVDDRPYIASLSAPKLSGWLQREAMVQMLDGLDVTVIYCDTEGTHRIIDKHRVKTHAGAWRLVFDTEGRGVAHCRSCGLIEPGRGAALLVAQRAEERSGGTAFDQTGRRVDLRAASGYAHAACMGNWERLTAIARQYESEAEAMEADRQAGREEEDILEPTVMVEPEPEPDLEAATTPRRDYYGSQVSTAVVPTAVRGRTTSEIHEEMLARRRQRKGQRHGD